ncbi:MAG TPA: protoglobin domain-containing protein [Planctomycetota bacterium]|nr:protoglobin domain-containing protein [Planctomycetota bacterium]
MERRFLDEVKRYVDFREEDARTLLALRPMLEANAAPVLDVFYGRILEHPRASRAITGGTAQVERLKTTLRTWLIELASGVYDGGYLAKRAAIGRRHVVIGLPQEFMVTAVNVVRVELARVVERELASDSRARARALEALHKILDLDLAIMLETYHEDGSQRALRESEARYSTLVEHAPLGIAIVREGRYAFVNDRYATIFGYDDPKALLGAPLETVYHEADRARALERWRPDRERWEETYARSGIRRADGKSLDLAVTRAHVEIDGRLSVQLIVRDVTDENRVARELDEARAQLEERRRLAGLGEMVAGIAHEIRNPLQGIAWGLHELRPRCKKGPELEALEKVAASTREIEAIVAEVLDYARPMKLDMIPFALGDLLQAVREDVAAQAEAGGVQVVVDADGAANERVLDPLKIKQALVNLARNAIEASSRGGRVELRTGGGETLFSIDVVDEGCGLPVELGDRVFLPFVTTKVKGTGLGLAVVRRIVEAHGGTVRLEPRQPRGTLARIELPSAR